ncbi:MAG: hypothetical protein MJ102_00970 [Clostridia bacterium]|nr:hypothetical protein [Clostridia bacterium]
MMPITGTYRHTLDSKNRLFLPSRHRDALGSPIVIYPSIRDHSLKVCSVEEWEKYVGKIENLPTKDREKAMRFFNENADTLVPDSQGRIVINQGLVDFSGISGTAVIVGCGKSVEIWSVEEYDSLKAESDVDALRETLESFGL